MMKSHLVRDFYPSRPPLRLKTTNFSCHSLRISIPFTVLVYLATFLLFVNLVSSQTCTNDKYEPNNDFRNASNIDSLTINVTNPQAVYFDKIEGVLCKGDTRDIYKFQFFPSAGNSGGDPGEDKKRNDFSIEKLTTGVEGQQLWMTDDDYIKEDLINKRSIVKRQTATIPPQAMTYVIDVKFFRSDSGAVMSLDISDSLFSKAPIKVFSGSSPHIAQFIPTDTFYYFEIHSEDPTLEEEPYRLVVDVIPNNSANTGDCRTDRFYGTPDRSLTSEKNDTFNLTLCAILETEDALPFYVVTDQIDVVVVVDSSRIVTTDGTSAYLNFQLYKEENNDDVDVPRTLIQSFNATDPNTASMLFKKLNSSRYILVVRRDDRNLDISIRYTMKINFIPLFVKEEEPGSNNRMRFNNGIIIGFGTTALAVLLFFGVFMYLWHRREKKKRAKKATEEVHYHSNGTDSFELRELRSPYSRNFPRSISSDKKFFEIDYNELEEMKEIGRGAFGVVFRCRWRETTVAVKQILDDSLINEKEFDDFRSEAETLKRLRPHPNVVLFLGITSPPQPLSIITEYCDGGSLYSLIHRKAVIISPEMCLKILSGIARGMHHLHSEELIHRDLAARNILLSKSWEPKVSDFGLSRQQHQSIIENQTKNNVGPLKWMSPESIRNKVYSTKSDVWSFGVVAWELLSRSDPFPGQDAVSVAMKICYENLRLPLGNWPPIFTQLMEDCWRNDPAERPSFKVICSRLNPKDQPVDLSFRYDATAYANAQGANSKPEMYLDDLEKGIVKNVINPYDPSPVTEEVADKVTHNQEGSDSSGYAASPNVGGETSGARFEQ